MEDKRNESGSVLLVDSGDLLFKGIPARAEPEKAMKRAELIARAYRYMKATAINVGDLDLVLGVDFLKGQASRGLPLISANLLDARTNGPIFDPYIVVERAGVRVAFMGLMDSRLPFAIQDSLGEDVIVEEPKEVALTLLSRLREQADVVVLLSDLGMSREQELVKEVRGIQIVFGGHDGLRLQRPYWQGTTPILESYRKGMYVGELQLSLVAPGLPFQNEEEADRLRHRFKRAQHRLAYLRSLKERNQDPGLDRHIAEAEQRLAEVAKTLETLETPLSMGNRLHWSLSPLEEELPPDETVQKWIRETGVQSLETS